MLDLVGPHEIGLMLGVGRQRVYQLVSRRDFPAPVAELAMGNVWQRADVLKWAAGKGRTVQK